jgi:PAS domain S-box-containing protein
MPPPAAEPQALESEARFRLLVESVKDYGIFALTPEGRVDTWNEGAQRLKGYLSAEIIGQHFSVFYPPADVAAGKCDMELDVASREGRFEDEGWRVRKDGTRFWANVVITALRDKAGTLIGFAKVTRDLTDRKAAEEEARRFRLLVESVKDYGIFILTPEGRIDTWNEGAQRLKGYTSSEIIGQHFSVFYPPADVSAGKCDMELDVASREGRFEDEGWRVRKDGTRFWANVVITALRDEAGTLVGFAKVTRDLTERKQAEETQRALAAETAILAEKARTQEFQERFLAILGHDLRNPLAAIDMAANLLRAHGPKDASTLRILDRIDASSLRMSRMIEQILDLTRSRLAGGLVMKRAPVDLRSTIMSVVEELLTVHPTRTIDVHCPPASGMWDRDRLEQVFSNLIANAIHYGSPEHPVTVNVRQEADSVVVEVHNQGVPIPEELQAKLFDPFRRGTRDSRTPTTEGLGLGLYISREIVLAHGGDINVSSTETNGTTFSVCLPLSKAAATRTR